MRSELQILTSRTNGAKSHGPVTPEGKLASAGNRLRHGLRADSVIIEGEDPVAFDALAKHYHDLLKPQDAVELEHVETMIMCRWRKMRLWMLESDNISHEIRKQHLQHEGETSSTRASLAVRTLGDETRSLDLYDRYEARFDRQFVRAHRRLEQLRAGKKPIPPLDPNK